MIANGVIMDDELEILWTQIIARDVAHGVEIAKAVGHKMPEQYAVGLRISLADKTIFKPTVSGMHVCFAMRLDDVKVDTIVLLPWLDNRITLKMVDEMWRTASEKLHAAAIKMSNMWLKKHPANMCDATIAADVIEKTNELDEKSFYAIFDRCREAAKKLCYKTSP